jgi:hypothetical protein
MGRRRRERGSDDEPKEPAGTFSLRVVCSQRSPRAAAHVRCHARWLPLYIPLANDVDLCPSPSQSSEPRASVSGPVAVLKKGFGVQTSRQDLSGMPGSRLHMWPQLVARAGFEDAGAGRTTLVLLPPLPLLEVRCTTTWSVGWPARPARYRSTRPIVPDIPEETPLVPSWVPLPIYRLPQACELFLVLLVATAGRAIRTVETLGARGVKGRSSSTRAHPR